MAPTAPHELEWQTTQIIKYLLEDEDEEHDRCCLSSATLEVDSPAGASNDDTFDPVLIADRLRSVADALNDNAQFRAAVADLRQAAAQEALEAAFGDGVEAICQTKVAQQADVASEMQLIRASVAFGLYIKKSSPELKSKIQSAMTAFLNRRVGPWVSQQGGWDKVIHD